MLYSFIFILELAFEFQYRFYILRAFSLCIIRRTSGELEIGS